MAEVYFSHIWETEAAGHLQPARGRPRLLCLKFKEARRDIWQDMSWSKYELVIVLVENEHAAKVPCRSIVFYNTFARLGQITKELLVDHGFTQNMQYSGITKFELDSTLIFRFRQPELWVN
jgi:hypothetical protein